MELDNACSKILVSKEEIENACIEIGKKISEDFKGEEVIMVGLLNGCNPFFSDLIKHVDLRCIIDYMRVSSYSGIHSGELQVRKDMEVSIEGKNVILVDDIVDTGKTFVKIKELIETKLPKCVKTCALLIKDNGIEKEMPDYYGIHIPDDFVIGYGLDYNGHYRNIPYIGVINMDLVKKDGE